MTTSAAGGTTGWAVVAERRSIAARRVARNCSCTAACWVTNAWCISARAVICWWMTAAMSDDGSATSATIASGVGGRRRGRGRQHGRQVRRRLHQLHVALRRRPVCCRWAGDERWYGDGCGMGGHHEHRAVGGADRGVAHLQSIAERGMVDVHAGSHERSHRLEHLAQALVATIELHRHDRRGRAGSRARSSCTPHLVRARRTRAPRRRTPQRWWPGSRACARPDA